MSEKLDILQIDEKIKRIFREEYTKLPEYETRLSDLQETLHAVSSPTYELELKNNIADIIRNIEKIESKEDYNFYLSETAFLIEEYKKILEIPVKLSFTGKTKTENPEKKRIIKEYLSVAKKYITISHNFSETTKNKCKNCDKDDFTEEEGVIVCTECGCEQDSFEFKSGSKEERIPSFSKSGYDRKVHFTDCINQYQGKQNCTIKPEVYENLIHMFERHHLLVGDEKTPKEIRFSKITRGIVLMFLKELNYFKHYENVILIHYHLTGKKPDDISYLEHKLLADFDLIIETYDKYFRHKINRTSFISTQYILYQLLQKYRHACKKEDFVIIKTPDRKIFHDELCGEIFEKLGWSFTPIN